MIKDLNNAVYVGVDVHRYENTAVFANRFEEELGLLTFNNDASGINKFIHFLKTVAEKEKDRIIGIEGSNGNGKLLTELVSSRYDELYEVNPIYTRQRRDHGTRGDKSDRVDAKLIVEVLTRKLKELPKITNQERNDNLLALEQALSFHDDLVWQQVRLKNQLHHLFKQEESTYQSSYRIAFSQGRLAAWQKRLRVSGKSQEIKMRRLTIKAKIKQIQGLQKLIGKTDKTLQGLLFKINTNLVTMPGVGVINASRILTAVKGVSRFPTVDEFVKYAGIAPIEKQSGTIKKHRQAKGGNRQLNLAIYTIALTQIRYLAKAKEYFEKKLKEGKTKKHALRCLMKRIACIVYGMLKNREVYRG